MTPVREYTLEMVMQDLNYHALRPDLLEGEFPLIYDIIEHGSEEQLREYLASIVEFRYRDYIDGWQIRTGRPYSSISDSEAYALANRSPSTKRSVLIKGRAEHYERIAEAELLKCKMDFEEMLKEEKIKNETRKFSLKDEEIKND
jgi:hypothetical protein